MITEIELNDYKNTGFSFFSSFIFIPAFTVTFNVFGYVSKPMTIINGVIMILTIISFVRRFIFLKKHRRFISNKQYYFQNISFITLIIWDVISGFFVYKESDINGGFKIKYNFVGEFNVALWIILLIFSFVLLGFMAATAKSVSSKMVKKMKEEFLDIDDSNSE